MVVVVVAVLAGGVDASGGGGDTGDEDWTACSQDCLEVVKVRRVIWRLPGLNCTVGIIEESEVKGWSVARLLGIK